MVLSDIDFFYHHGHPQKRVECEPVHSLTDMGIIFHCSGHLTIYVNVEYNHAHPRIVIVRYFSGTPRINRLGVNQHPGFIFYPVLKLPKRYLYMLH